MLKTGYNLEKVTVSKKLSKKKTKKIFCVKCVRFLFSHVRSSIIKRLHKKTDDLDLFIAFTLLVFHLITFRLNKYFPEVIGQ